jgi:site-specific recombinase XerD
MTGELIITLKESGLVSGFEQRIVPAMVAASGERAAMRYIEFFTANIRNLNTRKAYARAASSFFAWCERLGLALPGIQPVHVAAWIEQLSREGRSAPTVKQHLAAVRMLFDWLVVGQVVPHNPPAAVRGPKHSMGAGKTHMPDRDEAKALLAAIDTGTLIGLRDRALIGMLLFTFARMRVGDYYPVGKRWWVLPCATLRRGVACRYQTIWMPCGGR